MTAKMLERVLSCPTLPSLPGVAISMLELLRQPTCTADKVAELIQNDPALASKVLKTVNSSYYGLSKPCPTISRAVSFLGMNTVKSLTLGLSLVDVGKGTDSGFDLEGYWRRSVYGAAAARILSLRSRACDPDEVFIATLLQDVGMLACYAALGMQYAALMTSSPDHDDLPKVEQEQLGFDHAEAGAQMAEKWRLPEHIVACTRYHHRADVAPQAHRAIVRVVACSTAAAATLIAPDPVANLGELRRRTREWFNMDVEASDDLLHEATKAAKDLSKLLELDTGEPPDVGAILAEAGEQLLHHQVEMDRKQVELTKQTVTDGLTGAFNRKHFDSTMERAFRDAQSDGKPISVLFADADKFKSVNDTLGHRAGDAVLVEVARRLRDGVGEQGTVCRYGGEEFAIALPGFDMESARQLAERLRRAQEASTINIADLGLSARDVRQTISMGVSCWTSGDKRYNKWEALVQAADEAVYAAKSAGRNRVCCAPKPEEPAPMAAAPAPIAPVVSSPPAGGASPGAGAGSGPDGGMLILIVEDDALSAKMLDVLLTRHGRFRTMVARSAEDALRLLHGGRKEAPIRPNLVLADLNLPSMSGPDLIRACRATPSLRDLRFAIMSAYAPEEQKQEVKEIGAVGYFDKSEICSDIAGSLKKITELAVPKLKAA